MYLLDFCVLFVLNQKLPDHVIITPESHGNKYQL